MEWIPIEKERPEIGRQIIVLDRHGFVRKGEYVGLGLTDADYWMYFEPPLEPDQFEVWWDKQTPVPFDPLCHRKVITACGETTVTLSLAKVIWQAGFEAAKKH